jgi:hypothetical protein
MHAVAEADEAVPGRGFRAEDTRATGLSLFIASRSFEASNGFLFLILSPITFTFSQSSYPGKLKKIMREEDPRVRRCDDGGFCIFWGDNNSRRFFRGILSILLFEKSI